MHSADVEKHAILEEPFEFLFHYLLKGHHRSALHENGEFTLGGFLLPGVYMAPSGLSDLLLFRFALLLLLPIASLLLSFLLSPPSLPSPALIQVPCLLPLA